MGSHVTPVPKFAYAHAISAFSSRLSSAFSSALFAFRLSTCRGMPGYCPVQGKFFKMAAETINTPILKMLNIKYPVLLAGMNGVAGNLQIF